ncbi:MULTISPECIES: hypothetical protein [Burkholderia cepacia complex]|uniref:hypothetical protein n=1 Tax=Burkholderia cepacia complex TaxID=87882 RepID=UPI0012BB0C21|nr:MULTISPECIES: hypothetical protein [Burkholderia cepacia complex]
MNRDIAHRLDIVNILGMKVDHPHIDALNLATKVVVDRRTATSVAVRCVVNNVVTASEKSMPKYFP